MNYNIGEYVYKYGRKLKVSTCERCKKIKPIRSNGCCMSCVVSIKRERRISKLTKMFGGKCEICGYNKTYSALHFHHRDSENKDFGIAKKVASLSWNRVVKECKKCVLLCSNCHMEKEELEIINKHSNINGKCNICGKDINGKHLCKTCRDVKNRRAKIKKLKDMHGASCKICGYNDSYWSLRFHHISKEDKKFKISDAPYGFNKMLEESKKCILICGNCHMEIEYMKTNNKWGDKK